MAYAYSSVTNTKETYPEQNLDNDLCQAVVAGNMVFLRGQNWAKLRHPESVVLRYCGANRAGDVQSNMPLEEKRR